MDEHIQLLQACRQLLAPPVTCPPIVLPPISHTTVLQVAFLRTPRKSLDVGRGLNCLGLDPLLDLAGRERFVCWRSSPRVVGASVCIMSRYGAMTSLDASGEKCLLPGKRSMR